MVEEKLSIEDVPENTLKPIMDMEKVGGDLGTLAYLQALQNMNMLNQHLMKKYMESSKTSSSLDKEDIKSIVKEVVSSIMKELGAEVK